MHEIEARVTHTNPNSEEINNLAEFGKFDDIIREVYFSKEDSLHALET